MKQNLGRFEKTDFKVPEFNGLFSIPGFLTKCSTVSFNSIHPILLEFE